MTLLLSIPQVVEMPRMKQPAPHQLHGLVYSYKDGRQAPVCSWPFWLLHRSKKVWFRIPPQSRSSLGPVTFAYRGRVILYSGDLAERPSSERAGLMASRIIWGKHVKNGWGNGPDRTNYYLSIWTRWSLWHPAQCHPEWFTLSYGPSVLHSMGG